LWNVIARFQVSNWPNLLDDRQSGSYSGPEVGF
jgi:hypothetical protein